jgi:uncharacterized protein (TIGR03435 family)
MEDDWQLLEDYASRNSEEAFRELASRYTGLVYQAALRQTGNHYTAEEITQAVFIALAQKAAKIPKQAILAGWLFRAVRFAVLNHRRDDECRHRHEQEAFDMQNQPQVQTNPLDPVWETIVSVLDEALARLPTADREVLTLRYFADKSHKEAAVLLGVSEDAAKKRVGRALEKLRGAFARRGIHMASTALSAALSAHAAPAAPAGLSLTVAAVAIAKAPAAASTGALAASIIKLMAWANVKSAGLMALTVCCAAGTATITVHQVYRHSAAYWETPGFTVATLNDTPPQLTILPSKYPNEGRAIVDAINSDSNGQDFARLMGLGVDLEDLLQLAHHAGGLHHVTPPGLPDDRYDFIANLSSRSRAALAEVIRERFGYEARRETTMFTNALAIEANHAGAPGVRPATGRGMKVKSRDGKRLLQNAAMPDFAQFLGGALNVPVFDQTGLTNHYDLEFTFLARPTEDESIRVEWARKVLLEELGLKLVSSPGPHETLTIERVN